jgi:trigger factor
MLKEKKKLPKSQLEISCSLPWEEVERHLDEAAKELAKEIKSEGFRPGKAPREIVEQKLGSDTVMHEAAQHAMNEEWRRIMKEENVNAIGTPQADITKIAEGNDFEFRITVSVMPEAELKSAWKKEVKKANKKNSELQEGVTDEMVEKELQRLAESRAKLVTVDRVAKKDDSVQLDFDVLRNGVPIENGSAKNHSIVLGSGTFIPGFEEQIEGMTAGEEKEFVLMFPKEYHEKSLAGQEATFQVTLNVVQERQLPEMNDEFAKGLGKFETLEDLKKSIREGLEKESEQKQKETKRTALVDALVQHLEVDLPDVLVHQELHQMLAGFAQQLQMMGMEMEKYLEHMKKTREELEKEWEPQAIKRVKSSIAVAEVAKQEEIEPSAEDIEQEMNKTLTQYKGVKDAEKNVDMGRLYEYSKSILVSEKVFSHLENL